MQDHLLEIMHMELLSEPWYRNLHIDVKPRNSMLKFEKLGGSSYTVKMRLFEKLELTEFELSHSF